MLVSNSSYLEDKPTMKPTYKVLCHGIRWKKSTTGVKRSLQYIELKIRQSSYASLRRSGRRSDNFASKNGKPQNEMNAGMGSAAYASSLCALFKGFDLLSHSFVENM